MFNWRNDFVTKLTHRKNMNKFIWIWYRCKCLCEELRIFFYLQALNYFKKCYYSFNFNIQLQNLKFFWWNSGTKVMKHMKCYTWIMNMLSNRFDSTHENNQYTDRILLLSHVMTFRMGPYDMCVLNHIFGWTVSQLVRVFVCRYLTMQHRYLGLYDVH